MVARNVVVSLTCTRRTRSDPGSIPGTAKIGDFISWFKSSIEG